MTSVRFPNPRHSTSPDGLIAVGGNLRPETLLAAYRQGIFPWPVEGWPLTWFSPLERAVLDFTDLHVPRRLARIRRSTTLHLTIDRDFERVIRSCAAAKRPGEEGTWITPEMIRAYVRLHKLGTAHSVEAWEDEVLVGGVYGVDAGGAFAGESMFRLVPNASKLALLRLIEHLQSRGLEWIDIQVMTPHMETLGAKLITRDDYLDRLAVTQSRNLKLFEL